MISAGRKHVVISTGSSPFKVRDNQRPERTMSGARKPPPESSVPGETLPRGSRRNQLRRGHGSPPVLGEVPHELSTAAHSKEGKRSPQQFIPAGFPLHNNLPMGTEDSDRLPHYTGHGPFRTRPPTSVKSPYVLVAVTCLNCYTKRRRRSKSPLLRNLNASLE